MSEAVNPNELAYHLLETVHSTRELVYLYLLGPVTLIRSEYEYVLTALDGFSQLLATRPIKNKQAPTVMAAIPDIFS